MKMSKHMLTLFTISLITFQGIFSPGISAKGPSKTPPGQAKKQEILPPGLSKKETLPPGLRQRETLPPGFEKRGAVPNMKVKDELKQAWCLERGGTVNYILPDKTRCDCVLETQAVIFTSEDDWMEAIGRVLYSAMTLTKDATIVAFEDVESVQLYIARLNKLIEHFELPIGVQTLPVTAEIQEQTNEESPEDVGNETQ